MFNENKPGQFLIDWELEPLAFKNQIDNLIIKARREKRVLPLPIVALPGIAFIDIAVTILSQVNCDKCDARCCKSNPNNQPLPIMPGDFDNLTDKYGKEMMEKVGAKFIYMPDGLYYFIPMPCPFLTNKNNRCKIYEDRPLACLLYPMQLGSINDKGNMLVALASECLEGRRITRIIYKYYYSFRQHFKRVGDKEWPRILEMMGR